jgi:hypothetical protein
MTDLKLQGDCMGHYSGIKTLVFKTRSRWKIRCIVFVVNIILYTVFSVFDYYHIKNNTVGDYLDLQSHIVFYVIVYNILFIIIDLTLSTVIQNQWVTSAVSTILSPLVFFLALISRT